MPYLSELEQAMQEYNDAHAKKAENDISRDNAQSAENQRREEMANTINELNNQQLTHFLGQSTVRPLLDDLGILKVAKDPVKGLNIHSFVVPSINGKFGYNATLAYIPETGKDLSFLRDGIKEYSKPDNQPGLSFNKPTKQETVTVPEPISGIVIIKQFGTIILNKRRDPLVEIIQPKRFASERVYDHILTTDIAPTDLKSWVEQRFVQFIHTLQENTSSYPTSQ